MRLLYIVSKGMNDPTLASVPLHIAANGSLEVGQDVSVVLAGDATDLVIGENAQRMEGVGVPPMRELLSKLRDHQAPCMSERAARSPVGRRRTARQSSMADGRHPPT
jgi:predicted peroxiredoxin